MATAAVVALTGLTPAAQAARAAPADPATRAVHTEPAPRPAATGTGTATSTDLAWQDCDGDTIGTGIQCATLDVPLDYADPNGRQIQLALTRHRHTSSEADYQGPILVNFGGPGASGLSAAGMWSAVPHRVGRDYDWIGWDPRGVGHSRPALHCDRHYFDPPRRSYTPSTKSLLHYWLKRSRKYAEACERAQPALLQHMTTEDNARDIDSIRQALGVDRISYYGYSYGTYLGQVYATLFGQHLNRMVLDSTVDPRRVWYAANLDQDVAFNRNVRLFFRWIAKHHRNYHLGRSERSVEHRYYQDLRRLTHHPAGKLGPAEFIDAFSDAGYDNFDWPTLAEDWRAFAHHRHHSGLVDDANFEDYFGDDNGYAVYNAVQCTDVQWPTKWSTWSRDNHSYAKRYPFFTWSNAWFNAPCLYWKAPAHRPVPISGAHVSSALLIDQTLDAATPYRGSLEVRKLFRHSRLIAEPGGTTHADSLDGDRCVDDRIASYLHTGALPKRRHGNRADVRCKPLPVPTP